VRIIRQQLVEIMKQQVKIMKQQVKIMIQQLMKKIMSLPELMKQMKNNRSKYLITKQKLVLELYQKDVNKDSFHLMEDAYNVLKDHHGMEQTVLQKNQLKTILHQVKLIKLLLMKL
jgi:hypothetical protein